MRRRAIETLVEVSITPPSSRRATAALAFRLIDPGNIVHTLRFVAERDADADHQPTAVMFTLSARSASPTGATPWRAGRRGDRTQPDNRRTRARARWDRSPKKKNPRRPDLVAELRVAATPALENQPQYPKAQPLAQPSTRARGRRCETKGAARGCLRGPKCA